MKREYIITLTTDCSLPASEVIRICGIHQPIEELLKILCDGIKNHAIAIIGEVKM